ncbi:tetratricopeptide repeat protein [Paractinoplanes maris]|uniref:tetratricopeptide repeat protein n=1 Tax=Paractinoplanes maris TaxID=1734446 RepID=UPI0020210C84|nr:tetratricopeptide repeat protein [Actinoplanes maris]
MAAPLEPETTPEEYRQRALLLADLGRYDEAAQEVAAGLTAAPDEPGLLATLARIHLAAEQPAEALRAAEKAVAAAPDTITNLVVRAMALTDSQKYGDAARVASGILAQWPADAYAQRTGAALLSESRNGQEALNAAWNAVRIAPADAEAHLVLAVVAARLRLFDLAQRAYTQSLDLDPAIGDAQHDMGIVRFERRRWAKALEALADEATLSAQAQAEPDVREEQVGDYPEPFPRAYQAPDRPEPKEEPQRGSGSWAAEPSISKPSGPVLDPSEPSAAAVRQAVVYGANATLIAGVMAGLMTLSSDGISQVWAGLVGVLIVIGLLIGLRRTVPEPVGAALSRLRAHNRPLAGAAYIGFVAPLVLVVYAVVGGIVSLVAAMVLAAVAELLVLTRR